MRAIAVGNHPKLEPVAFETQFDRPLEDWASPAWLVSMLSLGVEAPFTGDDVVRTAVRDMLRTHGYKPSGRGKPASEYLVRAASEASLSSINPAVDVCNVVSLHSGLPISVVDVELASEPFRIAVAPPGSSYVFNTSGQFIRLDGLPCLFDVEGPCANAVRDSQRTKTRDSTRTTLSVVWGTSDLAGRSGVVSAWYRELLGRMGAETRPVELLRIDDGAS
ncbi:MAG: phenylalanine--tRNA ligase beta subunit-related protein [Rhodothermales bacterium]